MANIWRWIFCLFLVLSLIIPSEYASGMGALLPSEREITSLFDPYPPTPQEPDIYSDMLDYSYNYHQSKSYNPPRDAVDIFFRIKIYEFEPDEKESQIRMIQESIQTSIPDTGSGIKKPIDIGETGYLMELYDTYAEGPPIGCEIKYLTGNYQIWVAYTWKIDSIGYGTTYEDASGQIQKCLNILKTPDGYTDSFQQGPESELFVTITPDEDPYQQNDPYKVIVLITDEKGAAVSDAYVSGIFSVPAADKVFKIEGKSDSTGMVIFTGTWPDIREGKAYIRAEVEKDEFQSGFTEIQVSIISQIQPDEEMTPEEGKSEESTNNVQLPGPSNLLISTYVGEKNSHPALIGWIKIMRDGEYVTWYPETSWDYELIVTIPATDGTDNTIIMRTPIQPDGTFLVSSLDSYANNTDTLVTKLKEGTFTEKILKNPEEGILFDG